MPSAWRVGTRQRKFSKNKIKALCRVPHGLALGKEIFFKKIKNICRAPHGLALGKEIFKKKLKKSLPSACRVGTRQSDHQWDRRRDGSFSLPSVPGALGKLCRVPDKIHSAKRALPINFLPCVLCRVPHSAKALPSAIWPLQSACLRHSAKNLNPVVWRGI